MDRSSVISLPELGDLIVFDVYEFYDEPILFAASNERGQMFLGLLVQNDVAIKRWLYAPLTSIDILGLKEGWKDTYTVFRKPEGGRVFEATIYKDGEPLNGAWINSGDLSDSDLPTRGTFLDSGGFWRDS